ncbi:hypothetical protein [Serratia marcescens]|uniref:hypothetical protein n=1 Tax=Serratia marcescens TaxID=615 RepID=UPI00132677F9|nr:hypothetical protein [Serratia marcescens]MXS93420.1 hypothetical protein [Serratia marcescens]QHJ26288.1 hypothetical protein GV243_10965 [Serratia marcescens]
MNTKHYLAKYFRDRYSENTEQRHAAFTVWLASDWKPFSLREINFMVRYVRMFKNLCALPTCLSVA